MSKQYCNFPLLIKVQHYKSTVNISIGIMFYLIVTSRVVLIFEVKLFKIKVILVTLIRKFTFND